MKTHLYKIECVTDMHVGSGEANYSIIDNEVQKDTVLIDVPIIHASGVKGATREHFGRFWGKDDPRIKEIFGDREDAGQYKFFNAFCIARPLRVSSGDRPYILTTSAEILASFSDFLRGLGLSSFYSFEELVFDKEFLSSVPGIEIEGSETKHCMIPSVERLIGKEFAVAKSLRNYDLPTHARNQLENGQSKHLWYEELVPHKSIFYFAVITPNDTCALDFGNSGTVQFGGNATIGNGYTRITEVQQHEKGD